MIFHDRVVFSEEIKKPEKAVEKLHSNKGFKNYYLVVFKGESVKPEIYTTLQFKQKHFKTDDFNVIGVFVSEDEAIEMIRALAEISVNSGTDFDFKKAFELYGEVSK